MATKDFSSKQEKTISDFLGWDTVSGSGARACHPGDIIGEEWLGECKTHVKEGHKIFFSLEVWDKIIEEAIFQHRNPILFADDGSQRIDRTWCMINHFSVDSNWKVAPLGKKFKSSINMNHEDLIKLYDVSGIIGGTLSPICYMTSLGKHQVVLLPLKLFKYMFS